MLVPKRENGKIVLLCNKCRYSKELKSDKGYKSRHKVKEDKKIKILVMEPTTRDKEKITAHKELLQEYYEVLLETMEQEEIEQEEV